MEYATVKPPLRQTCVSLINTLSGYVNVESCSPGLTVIVLISSD